MATTRMTNADAVWLHMDRPTNHMIVNSVMWFDEPVDWERLRRLYEQRLLAPYPRFRQRPVERRLPLGPRCWEEDPDFDLERHLIPVRLPEPGGRAELHRYVSAHMSRPLDRDRPLWQAHLIDGFDGGSAVYTRIHHSVADGIALVRLLLSMTDDQPDGTLFQPPSASVDVDRDLIDRIGSLVSGARRVSGLLVHESREIVRHPGRAVRLAEVAASGSRALARELLIPPDRRTVLKGTMGTHKHATWSGPIPLADVKAIGRAHGATVNDVLCAAVTGALHRYLEHRDSVVPDIRAMVPVNLRPLDQPLPRDLGNQFGLVFLSLPVGLTDPTARIAEVKRRMDAIKDTPEGAVSYGVLSVIGMTSAQVEKHIVDVFASKGSLVLTNVPGPVQPVYLAGTRLAGTMGWVPAAGGIAVGLSIFSYVGEVTVGVYADARLVPDPEALVEAFNAEVAAMPW